MKNERKNEKRDLKKGTRIGHMTERKRRQNFERVAAFISKAE